VEGQRTLFEASGYRVLTATNATDAVEAFKSHAVDLVLLDYHIPGMNGAVAAARMKDRNPDVPIILMSGDEDVPPGDLEVIDCFLSKGGSISSLLEKIDYLLGLRVLFRPIRTLETQSRRANATEAGSKRARLQNRLFEK
jgi:CheY-like chemotaxis protein